jgi:hypothetical protein
MFSILTGFFAFTGIFPGVVFRIASANFTHISCLSIKKTIQIPFHFQNSFEISKPLPLRIMLESNVEPAETQSVDDMKDLGGPLIRTFPLNLPHDFPIDERSPRKVKLAVIFPKFSREHPHSTHKPVHQPTSRSYTQTNTSLLWVGAKAPDRNPMLPLHM